MNLAYFEGPGIFATNNSLMEKVLEEPHLAETLLKVVFF